MQKIRAACVSCDNTGLYAGMCEAKGTAVICQECEGKGWHWLSYKPFVTRAKRKGIKSISISRGTFLPTGVGKVGESMTYAQFEAKFPDKVGAENKANVTRKPAVKSKSKKTTTAKSKVKKTLAVTEAKKTATKRR